MYSIKQSHGAVEKKMLSTCFLKKMRKKEKSRFMFEVYKHKGADVILVSVTGMFSLTVMLCDAEDEDNGSGREC